MTYVINTIESISELALALYDERDETLREVTSDDLVFPVFANKRIIKRLYLIGEFLYKKKITVSVTSSDTQQYITKLVIGREGLRYSDFSEYTNTYTTTYDQCSDRFLNALPVDILIESTGFSAEDVGIDIDIKVEE